MPPLASLIPSASPTKAPFHTSPLLFSCMSCVTTSMSMGGGLFTGVRGTYQRLHHRGKWRLFLIVPPEASEAPSLTHLWGRVDVDGSKLIFFLENFVRICNGTWSSPKHLTVNFMSFHSLLKWNITSLSPVGATCLCWGVRPSSGHRRLIGGHSPKEKWVTSRHELPTAQLGPVCSCSLYAEL